MNNMRVTTVRPHVRLTESGPVTVKAYIKNCPVPPYKRNSYGSILKKIEAEQTALMALDACRNAEGNPTLSPKEALRLCGQWRKTGEDKLSNKHMADLINAGWLNADGDVMVDLDKQLKKGE